MAPYRPNAGRAPKGTRVRPTRRNPPCPRTMHVNPEQRFPHPCPMTRLRRDAALVGGSRPHAGQASAVPEKASIGGIGASGAPHALSGPAARRRLIEQTRFVAPRAANGPGRGVIWLRSGLAPRWANPGLARPAEEPR